MKQVYNPYLPSYEYVPDGEPHAFGDRIYLYGSHDRFNGGFFCLNDYVCYSAPVDDLSAWRYEGVIYKKKQDPLNKLGIRLLTGARMLRVEKTGAGLRAVYEVDGKEASTDCQQVLMAAGRKTNLSGIDAQALGLELNAKQQIVVDAHQRTNLPGVYAIGDVVGGSVPPNFDKSTHGSSADLVAMVFTENAKENPWKTTYAEEARFKPGDSIVTHFSAYLGNANIDHDSKTGQRLLTTLSTGLLGSASGLASCLADYDATYAINNKVSFAFIVLRESPPRHASADIG